MFIFTLDSLFSSLNADIELTVRQLYMIGNLYDPHNSPPSPVLFILQSSSYMVIPLVAMLRGVQEQRAMTSSSKKHH